MKMPPHDAIKEIDEASLDDHKPSGYQKKTETNI
jgi:hypothetical protein